MEWCTQSKSRAVAKHHPFSASITHPFGMRFRCRETRKQPEQLTCNGVSAVFKLALEGYKQRLGVSDKVSVSGVGHCEDHEPDTPQRRHHRRHQRRRHRRCHRRYHRRHITGGTIGGTQQEAPKMHVLSLLQRGGWPETRQPCHPHGPRHGQHHDIDGHRSTGSEFSSIAAIAK
jgi:hypothetical protein